MGSRVGGIDYLVVWSEAKGRRLEGDEAARF